MRVVKVGRKTNGRTAGIEFHISHENLKIICAIEI
jgi:hypothetical protein